MSLGSFQRKYADGLTERIAEPRRFIQVLAGPRQVGKTTSVSQALTQLKVPYHSVTADAVIEQPESWVALQWQRARLLIGKDGATEAVLVMDEIQKVPNWSEAVKKLWDDDTANGTNLKVVLLGSSRLMLMAGLTESLTGRFELTLFKHWSLKEMNAAFGWTADQYAWLGAYPGTVSLAHDEHRWKEYVSNALIETSISKDVLMLTRVDKPALLRRLFDLGCNYSAQMLSYTKMLGQLLDAGNTVTLAHYLELLASAGLLTGLEKYAPNTLRQRSSSPKFQVYNNALMSAQRHETLAEAKADPILWGRVVESAVGAHLVNAAIGGRIEVHYWRDRNNEVDFVLTGKGKSVGIEVKSNGEARTKGMDAFQKTFRPDKILLVGDSGMPWQEFLTIDPLQLL